MSSGRLGAGFVLLASLGLLAAGLGRLFELEFSGGESYGRGSSLRADREGAMILYESLEAVEGLEVRRANEPLEKTLEEVEPSGTVLVMLNAGAWTLESDPDLAEFVRAGGTVLASVRGRHDRWDDDEEDEETGEDGPEAEEDEKSEPVEPLGLDVPPLKSFGLNGPDAEAGRVRGAEALPPDAPSELDWPAQAVFDTRRVDLTGFTALYTLDGEPVMLEARRGEGRILLLSDVFPLLNEAMYTRRNSDWIAWWLEGARTVIFEEYHFGLRRPRGLAALMWSYRLQGLVFGLGLPFLLLIWHGAVPLLPPLTAEEEAVAEATPQSRLGGLRDLLARHVPAGNLLGMCVREWKAAFLRAESDRKRYGFLEEQADNVLSDPDLRKSAHLSAGYQRLHNILTQKRTRL